MKRENHIFKLRTLAFIFIIVPILLYTLGEFNRRNLLMEALSLITILAFSLLIAQFYLTRSNKSLVKKIRMVNVLNIHKFIGYVFIIVIMLHPFFIIVPKFFDNTLTPVEAFTTILENFDILGVILGIVAYITMLIILFTSFFRFKLNLKYRTWRAIHGYLALFFILTALWHVINMGRHVNTSFSMYFIISIAIGIIYLLRTYLTKSTKKTIKNV